MNDSERPLAHHASRQWIGIILSRIGTAQVVPRFRLIGFSPGAILI